MSSNAPQGRRQAESHPGPDLRVRGGQSVQTGPGCFSLLRVIFRVHFFRIVGGLGIYGRLLRCGWNTVGCTPTECKAGSRSLNPRSVVPRSFPR